jgi:hypothetical protein
MTLTLNIMMGGALTGAPFNPARALGPMVATGNFTNAWLYMVAPVVGAVIAAFVHLALTRLAREQRMVLQASTPRLIQGFQTQPSSHSSPNSAPYR